MNSRNDLEEEAKPRVERSWEHAGGEPPRDRPAPRLGKPPPIRLELARQEGAKAAAEEEAHAFDAMRADDLLALEELEQAGVSPTRNIERGSEK